MKVLSSLRRGLKRWRWALIVLIALAAALTVIRFYPRPGLADAIPLSTVVRDREGRLLRLALASDQRYRLWVPLDNISPQLVESVMLQEDAWFYWHPGFNPISLVRGAWSTYGSGEARVGGSTLTMQLARLRWRLQTRDIRGKLVQIGMASHCVACRPAAT